VYGLVPVYASDARYAAKMHEYAAKVRGKDARMRSKDARIRGKDAWCGGKDARYAAKTSRRLRSNRGLLAGDYEPWLIGSASITKIYVCGGR
jgi:hypothetical protein